MGTTPVEVAITPFGSVATHSDLGMALKEGSNADAIVETSENTSRVIATPLKAKEPFKDFLRYVVAQELGQVNGDVKYAQTRNHAVPNIFSMRCINNH